MVGCGGIRPDFRWVYLMIISLGLLHVSLGQEVRRSTDAELNETYKTWSIAVAVLSMVTLAAIIVLAGFFFMTGKGDKEKRGRRVGDKGMSLRTHGHDGGRTLAPLHNQPTNQHSQPRASVPRHQPANPLRAQGWPHRDVIVQPLVDVSDDQADQPTPSTSIEDYERDMRNYRNERDLREAQMRMFRDQAGDRTTTRGWHHQNTDDHADQQSILHYRYEADLQELEENRDVIFNPEFLQSLDEYMYVDDPAPARRYKPAAPVIRRSFLPALPAPQTAAAAPVYYNRNIPIGVGAIRDASGAFRPSTSIYGGGSRMMSETGTASVSYNPTAVSPDPRTSSVLY